MSEEPETEFALLFDPLSHDQKLHHLANVRHLMKRHGESFGDRAEVEIKLLKGDAELASILTADPPVIFPIFDEAKKAVTWPSEDWVADISDKPDLFLGEAIGWVISRGLPISTGEIADRWDDAERELFKRIDVAVRRAGLVVEGYPEGAPSNSHEPLPTGIWSRMNGGKKRDPAFSSIDGVVEERDDGGTVYVGGKTWHGVRLPTSFVLEHWPPRGTPTQQMKERQDDAGEWVLHDEEPDARQMEIDTSIPEGRPARRVLKKNETHAQTMERLAPGFAKLKELEAIWWSDPDNRPNYKGRRKYLMQRGIAKDDAEFVLRQADVSPAFRGEKGAPRKG